MSFPGRDGSSCLKIKTFLCSCLGRQNFYVHRRHCIFSGLGTGHGLQDLLRVCMIISDFLCKEENLHPRFLNVFIALAFPIEITVSSAPSYINAPCPASLFWVSLGWVRRWMEVGVRGASRLDLQNHALE